MPSTCITRTAVPAGAGAGSAASQAAGQTAQAAAWQAGASALGAAGAAGAAGAETLGLKSLSRRALVTTLTELKLMAAAANHGVELESEGVNSTPAASGMPMEL